jgi:hypothetical protein
VLSWSVDVMREVFLVAGVILEEGKEYVMCGEGFDHCRDG